MQNFGYNLPPVLLSFYQKQIHDKCNQGSAIILGPCNINALASAELPVNQDVSNQDTSLFTNCKCSFLLFF